MTTVAAFEGIPLDHGDPGLIFIGGLFRPADAGCRVSGTWKDMATDRVMQDVECANDAPLFAGKYSPAPEISQEPHWPIAGYSPAPVIGIPISDSPIVATPPAILSGYIDGGGIYCCATIIEHTPPPSLPDVAPVPLPATGLLLLAGLVLLGLVRK